MALTQGHGPRAACVGVAQAVGQVLDGVRCKVVLVVQHVVVARPGGPLAGKKRFSFKAAQFCATFGLKLGLCFQSKKDGDNPSVQSDFDSAAVCIH